MVIPHTDGAVFQRKFTALAPGEAGCTTSGCVRASVVDSMSYNYRTIVASDGVGDRAIGPHEANLFDMGQKYADLLICDEIVAHLLKQGTGGAKKVA